MLSNITWTNWIIHDFSNRVFLVMSVKNLCIQKYMERKAKASLCRKLLFLLFFWPSIYLKLETVHKVIESKKKKWMNIMHICDYGGGGWHFYHSCLYIKIKEQYTLEQYYYIALYRQQSSLEGNKYNNNKYKYNNKKL